MSAHERPRIALVGPDPHAHGGIASYLHALLTSPLARDYELIPVATYDDGGLASKAGQAVRGITEVRSLCAAGDVDLVHVHSSWGGSLVRKAAVVAVARRAGTPVVLQLHGAALERHAGSRLLGRTARAANALVVPTESWAAKLGAHDVSVVPNTPDVGPARPARDDGTVLFLGRLERAKGVFELVEVAARLGPSHPGLRVVIAGDGSERAALAAAGGVELPGWVDGERKAELLAEARCVVLPSYAEGVPLALLEAMAAGRPVVASCVGGIPEAAGGAALLVEPRDVPSLALAVEAVLDDDVLAAHLAARAATRARAFSKERVAELLAAVYDGVLSTTRRSQRSTQNARHSGSAGARPSRADRTERKSSVASQ